MDVADFDAASEGRINVDEKSILIGMLNYDGVNGYTVKSLVNSMLWFTVNQRSLGLDIQTITGIVKGRNKIARSAMQFPWLLFIDADMVWEPEVIVKLQDAMIARPKAGAMMAYAIMRGGKQLPIANWKKDDGTWVSEHDRVKRSLRLGKEKAVAKVDYFGCGFLMIRTEVFQDVPFPWFQEVYVEGTDAMVGEDVYFCWELQKAGWDTYVHFGARVGHWGGVIWEPEDE